MKTILDILGSREVTDGPSLKAIALDEAVKAYNAGDFIGAGEWYLSALANCQSDEQEKFIARTITLWTSSQDGVALPNNIEDVILRVHEFAGQDLALALVAVCSRSKLTAAKYPARLNDLVFKLAGQLSALFGVDSRLRNADLLKASISQHESRLKGLLACVEQFEQSDCLSARIAAQEVVKQARLAKTYVLAAERPFLGDLEHLLGGTFRGFCAHCERRNSSETAKAAPVLRGHVQHVLSNIQRRQNSVFWHLLVKPVGMHIVNLIDLEDKSSEEMTTPSLKLASSVFKLDLSKLDREMTFSCRLVNSSLGIAKNVTCKPDISASNVDLRLLEPEPGFEVGAKSEQVVTFAITLHRPTEKLLIPLTWTASTVRGKHYQSSKQEVTIQQQKTQPDWERLRLDPPYGTKAINRRDRLYGRNAVLKQLTVCASGGTSAFIWGAKRVGKTSVMQVLVDELRHIPGFVPIYIRVGEIVGFHEGQIAFTVARRLCERLGSVNLISPREAEFGASIAPLLPFAEKLVEQFPDRRFVVIIDEFDDLDTAFYTGQRGRLFVKALRSLSEVGLTFFFVGSERMQTIYSKHAMDLNKWDSIYLDVIASREDCKSLVFKPVERAIEYQPECLDMIVDYCGGNPFYMHLICSEVFNRCSVEERTFVGESDLDSVQQSRIRGLGETNFAHFWDDNPELDDVLKQQQAAENCLVLCCLSRIEGRCENQKALYDLQETMGLGVGEKLSPNEIYSVLTRLANRKVVKMDGWRGYEIKLPIFHEWLSQNAETYLLPRWRKYCARLSDAQPNDTVSIPKFQESQFPISEEDLLQVSQDLIYCGKQKDAAEIRVWLRQFDDDVRIEIAFRLLKRLAERGFVSEGSRRRMLAVIDGAINAARTRIGNGSWRIITGRKDNLCVSFVDSDSEMKSGATAAREVAKSIRPGKSGPPDSIFDWMKSRKSQDPLVVLVDDFAGTGCTLSNGLEKFMEHPTHQDLIDWYVDEGRVLCYVLCAFPEAQDRIKKKFPKLEFVTAEVFGDEVRALDPNAGIFDDQVEINFARDMLIQIGQELCPQNALGFQNFAGLVCFHNTIPNNTLPIFWSNGKVNEKPWRPLFPRA